MVVPTEAPAPYREQGLPQGSFGLWNARFPFPMSSLHSLDCQEQAPLGIVFERGVRLRGQSNSGSDAGLFFHLQIGVRTH